MVGRRAGCSGRQAAAARPGSGQGGQGGAGDPREDIAAGDTGRAPANQMASKR